MPMVSCGCQIPNCQAEPHAGKDHCSSTCNAPTWGEDRWSEADTTWDGALDWNVRKIADKAVPFCRDCNNMMAALDKESGSAAVGQFDQAGMKLQEDR